MATYTYRFEVNSDVSSTYIEQLNQSQSDHYLSADWRHKFSEHNIALSDTVTVSVVPTRVGSEWRLIDEKTKRRFRVNQAAPSGRLDVVESTGTILVLSGGSPNSTLIAGALCALVEKQVKFDVVFTAGAGVLMGLLLVAPLGKSPQQALRDTVEMGVSDAIYNAFPVGYKTFFKPGPFTRLAMQWGKLLKFPTPLPDIDTRDQRDREMRRYYRDWLSGMRLYNDWVDFWVAALTPTDLNFFSKGLCDPLPFLEDQVDLDKVNRSFDGDFYINAFNLDESRMQSFWNGQTNAQGERVGITFDQVRAAFAMPFLYPPYEVDGRLYIEGADRDPLSFGNLKDRLDQDDIKNIIVMDILGSLDRFLVREPRNLMEAYAISVMTPGVALAERSLADLEDHYPHLPVHKVQFEIAPRHQHHILDWSYTNLSHLWDIGYQAGQQFYETYGRSLTQTSVPMASLVQPHTEKGTNC